jgi:hypothetical protein
MHPLMSSHIGLKSHTRHAGARLGGNERHVCRAAMASIMDTPTHRRACGHHAATACMAPDPPPLLLQPGSLGTSLRCWLPVKDRGREQRNSPAGPFGGWPSILQSWASSDMCLDRQLVHFGGVLSDRVIKLCVPCMVADLPDRGIVCRFISNGAYGTVCHATYGLMLRQRCAALPDTHSEPSDLLRSYLVRNNRCQEWLQLNPEHEGHTQELHALACRKVVLHGPR